MLGAARAHNDPRPFSHSNSTAQRIAAADTTHTTCCKPVCYVTRVPAVIKGLQVERKRAHAQSHSLLRGVCVGRRYKQHPTRAHTEAECGTMGAAACGIGRASRKAHQNRGGFDVSNSITRTFECAHRLARFGHYGV